jgi:AbrB family looped-hinge helix DNA binding protein
LIVRSKVTSKFRTVIPKPVRERLGLKGGDALRYRIADDGDVTVEKAPSVEGDPFVSFEEWRSDEDDVLYRGL